MKTEDFGMGMPTRDEVIAGMRAARANGTAQPHTLLAVPPRKGTTPPPAPQPLGLDAAFERRMAQESEDLLFMRHMGQVENALLVTIGLVFGLVIGYGIGYWIGIGG